jgi:hypothetical protein
MRVEGVFTIACLVKAGCTSADSRRSGFLATPVEKPGFQILYSDPDFTAEPEEVAASGDPDYQRVLRQAAGKHGDALDDFSPSVPAADGTRLQPNSTIRICVGCS